MNFNWYKGYWIKAGPLPVKFTPFSPFTQHFKTFLTITKYFYQPLENLLWIFCIKSFKKCWDNGLKGVNLSGEGLHLIQQNSMTIITLPDVIMRWVYVPFQIFLLWKTCFTNWAYMSNTIMNRINVFFQITF